MAPPPSHKPLETRRVSFILLRSALSSCSSMFGTQTGHRASGHNGMARRIRSADLETRTARLKVDVRKKPYTARIAPGIPLAYRRNQGCGVWSVLKADGAGGAWLQRFALADDHEESNSSTVLTFWEAA